MRVVRVLIADAADGVRQVLSGALAAHGYEVLAARHGDAALRTLRAERVDILVVDLFVPGTNGVDCVRQARLAAPHCQVIALSAGAPVHTVVSAMKAGALDVLEKPLDGDRVLLAVDRALELGRLRSQELLVERAEAQDQEHAPVVASAAMAKVADTAVLVAATDLSVLIEGEPGVGKERLAKWVHRLSTRARMPFVALNCSAFAGDDLEYELFGRDRQEQDNEARERHVGLMEVADRGTLFIDGIEALPASTQLKVLQAIETKQFRRIGGKRLLHVDLRLVVASTTPLVRQVRKGQFREDLYYRLNVIHIAVPPLRERRDDLRMLVDGFVGRAVREKGLRPRRFTKDALDKLGRYHWPGNVRELENLVERALLLAPSDVIRPRDLPAFLHSRVSESVDQHSVELTLAQVERNHIAGSLRRHNGNKSRTAKALGINIKTLYNKIRNYGIDVEMLKDG